MAKPRHTSFERWLLTLSVVLLLVIFFIEKTPTAICLSGLLIYVVSFSPLINTKYILGHKRRQIAAAVVLFVVVVFWMTSAWPGTRRATSDIRVQDETPLPIESDLKPNVSIGLYSDSASTIYYHSVELCATGEGTPNIEALEQNEKELWGKLEEKLDEDRKRAKNNTDFYFRTLPPKVRSLTTTSCSSLTPIQFRGFKAADGNTWVYYMAIYVYEGLDGEEGTENCAFTQGKGALIHCYTGHIGPREVRKRYWQNASACSNSGRSAQYWCIVTPFRINTCELFL